MTAAQLATFRRSLNLGRVAFAKLFRVKEERTIRRWEAGTHPISDQVLLIIDIMQKFPDVKAWMVGK